MGALNLNFDQIDQIIDLLKMGGVGIMPTDTIYGIVGSALLPKTVEEIYTLRKRAKDKPFIILISSIDHLKKFDITITPEQKNFLEKIWPNPVSVILTCPEGKFTFLHRGKKSLAFRIPKDKTLLALLEKVGPLVAPSANITKEKPAETIEEAKIYFGEKPDFYVDKGRLKSKPSAVMQLYEDGSKIILRKGSFPVENIS